MYQMEDYSSRELNAMNALPENSRDELRKGLASSFPSTGRSHDEFEISEPSNVSVSMLQGIEFASFADTFSSVETSKCHTGYAILFGCSIISFIGITISNFISDPTLFLPSHSDDLEEGKMKNFEFLLLIILLYLPVISALVIILFRLRKYIPKIASIGFRVASYGLILVASFRLLISDPIAFSLLVAGIACIWFRKWLASSIDIIQNVLHDSVVMYESFPKFTILVFFGLLADGFCCNLFKKIIQLTHIHFGIQYFGYRFSVKDDNKSSASPMKVLTLIFLHLNKTFIESVTNSILISAVISAYCLVQYHKNAPLGTPFYKNVNFFKLFYTKGLSSMCCTSVLPILTQSLHFLFKLVIPEDGSTFENFLSYFSVVFDMAMSSLDICALSYMTLSETGYFQSFKHIITICRQKRWHTLKNILLINFSVFIFVVLFTLGEFLVVSGCSFLFGLIFRTGYISIESEYFNGISEPIAEMIHTLALCRFILPILVSERLEMKRQKNFIKLQNIQASSEKSSENV